MNACLILIENINHIISICHPQKSPEKKKCITRVFHLPPSNKKYCLIYTRRLLYNDTFISPHRVSFIN